MYRSLLAFLTVALTHAVGVSSKDNGKGYMLKGCRATWVCGQETYDGSGVYQCYGDNYNPWGLGTKDTRHRGKWDWGGGIHF